MATEFQYHNSTQITVSIYTYIHLYTFIWRAKRHVKAHTRYTTNENKNVKDQSQ